MTDESKDQPTQQTQPVDPGAAPISIPVPTREQVLGDFEKVAKAKPPAEPSQRESGPEQ